MHEQLDPRTAFALLGGAHPALPAALGIQAFLPLVVPGAPLRASSSVSSSVVDAGGQGHARVPRSHQAFASSASLCWEVLAWYFLGIVLVFCHACITLGAHRHMYI